jgi:hypothetical protein
MMFSEDGDHLAAVVTVDWPSPQPSGQTVLFDNKRGERYDDVSSLAVDRHGTTVGFIAKLLDESLPAVVINSRFPRLRDTLVGSSLVLSREGGRFAFVTRQKEYYYVATDRELVGPYNSVDDSSLQFSPDAEHLSFLALTDEQVLVLDGEPVGYCDSALGPVYDSVGRSIAYALYSEHTGQWQVTVRQPSGTASIDLDGYLDDLVLSPDGKHFAYTFTRPLGGMTVMLDTTLVAEYGQVRCLTFYPDSRRLAYAAFERGRWRVVADGDTSPGLGEIRDLVVSPNGGHWACWAHEGDDKWYPVVDGVKLKSYHAATSRIVFDGEDRLRCIARRWNTYYRVSISLNP